MASIGQLITAVSEVSGVDAASVKLIARYLREAGHIAQQSTGGGAARMTYSDAAALLIGVNASSLAKDAVSAVDEVSALPLNYITDLSKQHSNYSSIYKIVSGAPSFRIALERLIEFHGSDNDVSTVFDFRRPATEVGIGIWIEGSDDLLNARIAIAVFRPENYKGQIIKDRIINVRMTEVTLRSVAKALAS